MLPYTPQAQLLMQDLAQRYGVSQDAVSSLMQALIAGNSTMAQFNHPELGGSGQWMQGGMTMLSDMFNYGLQSRVNGLCAELAQFLSQNQVYVQAPPSMGHWGAAGGGGAGWWPAELGQPSASGSQNTTRYAYFPDRRRLAVDCDGVVAVYDTLDHQIGGFSQQQGYGGSATFSSQYGNFRIDSLPRASGSWSAGAPPATAAPMAPTSPPPPPPPPAQNASPGTAPGLTADRNEIFSLLQKLADLKEKGILTEGEFAAKKSELLSRL